MAQGQLSPVVRYLRRIAARQQDNGSDAQLLDSFFSKRDEAAFAELLDRHGPLVLAVCRRILQNFHDAEDVFQATFLVLARKGRSLRKRESLASWLHGVALRIALKARAQAARRHAREQSLGDTPVVDSTPDPIWRDLRPILDEEVNRLPEKYRLPFVLCYLEGKTNEEASHVLGCPRGTIFSRLAWARQRLCRRLTGRGIVLSLAALDFALAGNAGSAAVPAQLVQSTFQSAILVGSGRAMLSAVVSQQTAQLAEGVMRTMYLTRLKTAGIMALAIIVAGIGAGWLGSHVVIAEPAARATAAPAQKPARQRNTLDEKIRTAIDKGVAYLKKVQRDGGTWGDDNLDKNMPGGATSLAVLGLLEAGVKPDDPIVAKGLDYLRGLKPTQTYVISLQTLVFCRADPKKEHALIQGNVNLLLDAGVHDQAGRHLGWTYTKSNSRFTDNSNTQYAVLALDAGARSGARVDRKAWQEIRDYYLRTQEPNGGWRYNPGVSGQATFTMTCAGVCGLLTTHKQIKGENEGLDKAVARGLEFLGDAYVVESPSSQYYSLYGLARTGRLAEKKELESKAKEKSYNWYSEGAQWLVKQQGPDGAWKTAQRGFDANGVIDTSFALLFLTKDK